MSAFDEATLLLPADFGPAAAVGAPVDEAVNDPIWLEPFPDQWLTGSPTSTESRYEQRESVEIAFMIPYTDWFQGHQALRAWLVRDPLSVGWRHQAAQANGQLAVAGYLLDSESGRYLAHVIDVLTLDGDKIAAVTAFLPGDEAAAATFASFGLPPELP